MIRTASVDDVPAVLALVRELAEYEHAAHEVEATEDDLTRSLFGDDPKAFAHLAEQDGVPVGFALWFLNYSTWLGRHGVWLEDLYVTPRLRGAGLGRALLAELARICVRQGYGRLDWWVLDWNSAARGFYESLGAVAMEYWTVHRLTGPALRALADSAAGPAS